MELTYKLLSYFLLSVSLGLSLFSVLVRPSATGAGFIKLINNVNIASLMLLLVMEHSTTYLVVVGIIILTMIIGPVIAEGKGAKVYPLNFVAQNTAIFYLVYIYLEKDISYSSFYLFSGMIYLGIITYAMILGHWYLVVPRLSEQHLKKALILFWIILPLKLALMFRGYFLNETLFVSGATEAMGYMFNWIMLLMRLGWGYLVIAIMGYYTWRLTLMRSIQSATGVLYVMTFFVFIGELIAGYYHFKYGISL